jgi:hypothetical protein
VPPKELHPEAKPRIISDNGPPVHRQGLQGIHSDLGHDTRQNFTLISPIERENRTMAQIAQRRVHPAANATVIGRRAASGAGLRRALQQRPAEQRHRLHHAKRHARRTSGGDPRREGSEVGGGAKTAPDSSAAGCVKNEEAQPKLRMNLDYFRRSCSRGVFGRRIWGQSTRSPHLRNGRFAAKLIIRKVNAVRLHRIYSVYRTNHYRFESPGVPRCKFNEIIFPSLGDTGERRSRSTMRPTAADRVNPIPSSINSQMPDGS